MRLPFISRRRAQANLDLATAALRSAIQKAEARADALDQRLYEMQLAAELHDQQLHVKEES